MITYDKARHYKKGDFVRLDLSTFEERGVGDLKKMLTENNLIPGLEYQVRDVKEHNSRDPFVVFEIESNGKRVKLGSHLFS